MNMRDVSLTPRIEAVREGRKIEPPKHFSLDEILEHYKESLSAVKDQFIVADEMLKSGNETGCKMIWRSQVVLSEGLMDFYIHELSKYCLFQMFSGQWEKSEKYNNFMIPMVKVEEALNAAESKEWFFEYLNARLSRECYLASEMMKDQLNLIGIGFADAMKNAFSDEDDPVKAGQLKIQGLFKRRNEIAHQNDRSHASAEQTDITKQYVEEYIASVNTIVLQIHKIAVNKTKTAE